jgi:hypothetical protein
VLSSNEIHWRKGSFPPLIFRGQKDRRHTVLLHNRQELDNDLRARADHDLALALLLGVVDSIEAVVENGSASHLCGGIEV